MKNENANERLRSRLLEFSVNIIKMLSKLPARKEYEVIKFQLSKSATSIGANYEESQSSTYKEFVQKVRISLREANETKYWLKIIEKLEIKGLNNLNVLNQEIIEISRILGSISSKANKKLNKTNQ